MPASARLTIRPCDEVPDRLHPPSSFEETIRAVYAGTVDPDSYVLTLTVSPDQEVVTGREEDQP